MESRLLLSVVTPTYNAEQTIKDCLRSVNSQKRVSPKGRAFDVEQVVADGYSTDNTVAEIRSTESEVPLSVVSNPDRGIYDGMNKGIQRADGDVIAILNADDFYFSASTLGQVIDALLDAEVQSCYGNVAYVNQRDPSQVLRVWQSKSFNRASFKHGWMPPHPAFFVRRYVYEQYGLFREDIGTAGDYELMLRFLYCKQISCTHIPWLWVAMRSGGASNASFKSRILANRMDRRAWTVNGLRPAPWFRIAKPIRKLEQYVSTDKGRLCSELSIHFRKDNV